MKRPVFWAVVGFALGEVITIMTTTGLGIGIAFAMFLFGVWIFRKEYGKVLLVVAAFFFLGNLRVWFYDRGHNTEINGNKACMSGTIVELLKEENVEGEGSVCNVVVQSGNTKFLAYGLKMQCKMGQQILLYGSLDGIEAPTNPGEMNQKLYYLARGIRYTFSGEVLDNPKGKLNPILKWYYRLKNVLYEFRGFLAEILYRYADENTAALYEGILLGNKQNIGEETRLLYQCAGISHILAISGLHMGLFGLGLFRILRCFGISYGASACWAGTVLLLYGTMTGFSMSTIRAIIMLFIILGGELLGRANDLLTGLSVAVFWMLLVCPYRIYDGGFVLSVSAILGVSVASYCGKLLQKTSFYENFLQKHIFIKSIFMSLLSSFCVSGMLAPVLAKLYYVIPVYSVLINLLVLPFLGILLMSGILGLLFGSISSVYFSFIPKISFSVGKYIRLFYEMLCSISVKLPGNSINTGAISWGEILCIYLIIALFLLCINPQIGNFVREFIYKKWRHTFQRKQFNRWTFFVCIGLCLVGSILLFSFRSFRLKERVIFLDVGQGDGCLIKTADGTDLVVDGGSTSKEKLGAYILCPALKYYGMSRVEYWFVSHTDQDHISGLLYILNMGELSGIKIDNLVLSKHIVQDDSLDSLLMLATKNGVSVIYMDGGDCLKTDDFSVKCVAPWPGDTFSDKNAASLALVYSSKAGSVLFTGDQDVAAIEKMLAHLSKDTQFDILKVPHHGSAFSLSEELYQRIRVAVISVGAHNRYGHPAKEVLAELKRQSATIYRTDEAGAICFPDK